MSGGGGDRRAGWSRAAQSCSEQNANSFISSHSAPLGFCSGSVRCFPILYQTLAASPSVSLFLAPVPGVFSIVLWGVCVFLPCGADVEEFSKGGAGR